MRVENQVKKIMSVRKNGSLVRQLPYIVTQESSISEEVVSPSPPPGDMLVANATASMSIVVETTPSNSSSLRWS